MGTAGVWGIAGGTGIRAIEGTGGGTGGGGGIEALSFLGGGIFGVKEPNVEAGAAGGGKDSLSTGIWLSFNTFEMGGAEERGPDGAGLIMVSSRMRASGSGVGAGVGGTGELEASPVVPRVGFVGSSAMVVSSTTHARLEPFAGRPLRIGSFD